MQLCPPRFQRARHGYSSPPYFPDLLVMAKRLHCGSSFRTAARPRPLEAFNACMQSSQRVVCLSIKYSDLLLGTLSRVATNPPTTTLRVHHERISAALLHICMSATQNIHTTCLFHNFHGIFCRMQLFFASIDHSVFRTLLLSPSLLSLAQAFTLCINSR